MNDLLRLTDYEAISPLLILIFGSLILLLLESFFEELSQKFALPIALVVIAIAFFAALYSPASKDPLLIPWLRFDALSRFFTLFFLAIGFCIALLSSSFFQKFKTSHGEYFFLLLSAIFGLILIGSAADFLILFLGIETLSISLYVWCSYMKKWEIAHESALKYFLMGAMAAAFLLYGIALIYGAVGVTRFDALLTAYQAISTAPEKALFLGGIAFVTLGLCFEAAIVPFHIWAPDVYEGAPNPVTAFMAVGTKVGAFAAFVILFLVALPEFDLRWNQGLSILAYATLIYANFVALRQTQLRRFFAYSGISHAGFLLLPLIAGTPQALSALEFYLVVYALATLGSFAGLSYLDQSKEGVTLHDLQGFFQKAPFLASVLSFCLLTLAGIPPTAGFFAKFYIFKLTFQSGYYGLVIVGLLTTILSAFYYLRIVAVMFMPSRNEHQVEFSWPAAVVGIFSLSMILLLSIFPNPFLALLN